MPSKNSFPNSSFSYGLGSEIITGDIFFVDSGNANAAARAEGTRNQPFSSIENVLASGELTANNGDTIVAMAGHAETVSSDGALDLDVAGVTVIGLGRGASRPSITLDTAAAAAIAISAASCALINFRIFANFADITNMIDVTATDAMLEDIEFLQSGANLNWLDCVNASGGDNTADGLTCRNVRFRGIDAANNSFLNITGDIDRLTLQNVVGVHDHANALSMVLQATGKDTTDLLMEYCHYDSLLTAVDILYDNDTTANTGVARFNSASHADTAGETLIDCTGVAMIDNKATGVITASGYLLPAADS